MSLENKIHEVRCGGHKPGKGDWGPTEKGHKEKTLRREMTGTDLSRPINSVPMVRSPLKTQNMTWEFLIWSRGRNLFLRRETVLRAYVEHTASSRVGIRDYRVSKGGDTVNPLAGAHGEEGPCSPGKGESST